MAGPASLPGSREQSAIFRLTLCQWCRSDRAQPQRLNRADPSLPSRCFIPQSQLVFAVSVPLSTAPSAGSSWHLQPHSILGLHPVPCVGDKWFHVSWRVLCLPLLLESLTPILAFMLFLHSKFQDVDMQQVLSKCKPQEAYI